MKNIRFQKVSDVNHDLLIVEVLTLDKILLFDVCLQENTGIIEFRTGPGLKSFSFEISDFRGLLDRQEAAIRQWVDDIKLEGETARTYAECEPSNKESYSVVKRNRVENHTLIFEFTGANGSRMFDLRLELNTRSVFVDLSLEQPNDNIEINRLRAILRDQEAQLRQWAISIGV